MEQSSHKWGNAWLTGLFESRLGDVAIIKIFSVLISTLTTFSASSVFQSVEGQQHSLHYQLVIQLFQFAA